AQVRMKIRGRAIHPGWAKGELVNAIKLAAAIVEKLPQDRLSPETTEEREGYVHPTLVSGGSSDVELRFIVRDFVNYVLDAHSEREWICVEDMGLAAATVISLAQIWAE